MKALHALCVLLGSFVFLSSVASSQAAAPQVSASLAGTLREARAAQQAGNLDLEIATLLRAQSSHGHKTAFDDFLINSWLAVAYVNEREFSKAEPLLVAAAQSHYASPGQRKGFLQAASDILTASMR